MDRQAGALGIHHESQCSAGASATWGSADWGSVAGLPGGSSGATGRLVARKSSYPVPAPRLMGGRAALAAARAAASCQVRARVQAVQRLAGQTLRAGAAKAIGSSQQNTSQWQVGKTQTEPGRSWGQLSAPCLTLGSALALRLLRSKLVTDRRGALHAPARARRSTRRADAGPSTRAAVQAAGAAECGGWPVSSGQGMRSGANAARYRASKGDSIGKQKHAQRPEAHGGRGPRCMGGRARAWGTQRRGVWSKQELGQTGDTRCCRAARHR